jgi:hypothetical protein
VAFHRSLHDRVLLLAGRPRHPLRDVAVDFVHGDQAVADKIRSAPRALRLPVRLARTPVGDRAGKIGRLLAADFTSSLGENAQRYLREAEHEVQRL